LNRTVVALRRAASDEMTPRAGVRSFLNRLSLSGESAPERPGVDRLAERELLGEALSVVPRHGQGREDWRDLTVVGVFLRTAGGRHAGDAKTNRPATHRPANQGGVVGSGRKRWWRRRVRRVTITVSPGRTKRGSVMHGGYARSTPGLPRVISSLCRFPSGGYPQKRWRTPTRVGCCTFESAQAQIMRGAPHGWHRGPAATTH